MGLGLVRLDTCVKEVAVNIVILINRRRKKKIFFSPVFIFSFLVFVIFN